MQMMMMMMIIIIIIIIIFFIFFILSGQTSCTSNPLFAITRIRTAGPGFHASNAREHYERQWRQQHHGKNKQTEKASASRDRPLDCYKKHRRRRRHCSCQFFFPFSLDYKPSAACDCGCRQGSCAWMVPTDGSIGGVY